MRAIPWIALQAAVIGWWLWVDWDSARIAGTKPNPGVALAMGMFFAAIVSAGVVRLLDAWRYGWKASEPPPIAQADKIEGNLTVARFIVWPVALWLIAYGALRFSGDTTGLRMLQGVACIIAGASAFPVLYLIGKWARSRISVPVPVPSDDDARQGAFGRTALDSNGGQSSRERQRLAGPGRGGGEAPKLGTGGRIG